MGAGRPERAFLHMRNGRIGGAALGDLFERGMIFPAAENIPSGGLMALARGEDEKPAE
jgi:hypothetical protein